MCQEGLDGIDCPTTSPGAMENSHPLCVQRKSESSVLFLPMVIFLSGCICEHTYEWEIHSAIRNLRLGFLILSA